MPGVILSQFEIHTIASKMAQYRIGRLYRSTVCESVHVNENQYACRSRGLDRDTIIDRNGIKFFKATPPAASIWRATS